MKNELYFISSSFQVLSCTNVRKLFQDLTVWELLNLRVETVLGLPEAMYEQYGISPKYLQKVLETYSIQTIGREVLENEWRIRKPVQYIVSQTRHYSWPKGGGKPLTITNPSTFQYVMLIEY